MARCQTAQKQSITQHFDDCNYFVIQSPTPYHFYFPYSTNFEAMASRIVSPPERILRPLLRGVAKTAVRTYRAAVCQNLGKPLVIQDLPAAKALKNGQVCTVADTQKLKTEELHLVTKTC